jgi:hypothetical protein
MATIHHRNEITRAGLNPSSRSNLLELKKEEKMDLLSLPHWLMIAGAVFLATGFLGLAFTRNRQPATNPASESNALRSPMPPPDQT